MSKEIKKKKNADQPGTSSSSSSSSSTKSYTFDKILEIRDHGKGERKILVTWENYKPWEATWINESDIDISHVQEFEKQQAEYRKKDEEEWLAKNPGESVVGTKRKTDLSPRKDDDPAILPKRLRTREPEKPESKE